MRIYIASPLVAILLGLVSATNSTTMADSLLFAQNTDSAKYWWQKLNCDSAYTKKEKVQCTCVANGIFPDNQNFARCVIMLGMEF
jgi:hypothetical protein